MGRKILFRGFHPCDGPETIVVDGEKVKGKWIEGYLWSKRTIGVTSPCGNLDEVVVLPSTVGQYTGLTDNAGNQVFEGDILKIAKAMDGMGGYYYPPLEYPVNVEVKWNLCGWMWETLGADKYYIGFPDAWCHYNCEVIGTVFDEVTP